MHDLLRTTAGRKRARAAARLGFAPPPEPALLGPEPPASTDPLRPAPPSPDPAPPPPAPPRPGRVPAGPRGTWPPPGGDFIGQLIRRSRRY